MEGATTASVDYAVGGGQGGHQRFIHWYWCGATVSEGVEVVPMGSSWATTLLVSRQATNTVTIEASITLWFLKNVPLCAKFYCSFNDVQSREVMNGLEGTAFIERNCPKFFERFHQHA
jgi:hypothetical protein